MIVGLGWLAWRWRRDCENSSRIRARSNERVTSTSGDVVGSGPRNGRSSRFNRSPGPAPEASRWPEANLRRGMLRASVVVGSPHGEPPEPNARAIGPNRSGGDYAVAKSGSSSSFLRFAIAGSLLVICRVSAVCIRGSWA